MDRAKMQRIFNMERMQARSARNLPKWLLHIRLLRKLHHTTPRSQHCLQKLNALSPHGYYLAEHIILAFKIDYKAGFGARSRNRTGTTVKSRDFKSLVSTNFTTRADD